MVINEPRESKMRHSIITRRHIRDAKGRFTGLYRWGVNIRGLGYIEYPKTFAIMQLIVLATIFYFA